MRRSPLLLLLLPGLLLGVVAPPVHPRFDPLHPDANPGPRSNALFDHRARVKNLAKKEQRIHEIVQKQQRTERHESWNPLLGDAPTPTAQEMTAKLLMHAEHQKLAARHAQPEDDLDLNLDLGQAGGEQKDEGAGLVDEDWKILLPDKFNEKGDPGRCGPTYADQSCSCIGFRKYCADQSGWCGKTAQHKQLSTGKFDCKGTPRTNLEVLRTLPEFRDMPVSGLKSRAHAKYEALGVEEREYFWNDCDGALGGNKTQRLYRMLVLIDEAMQGAGIKYVISDGTLIGLKRSGRLNPYEVDNDITVDDNELQSKLALLKTELSKRNLILFEHDIPRVCFRRASPRLDRTPPWDCQFEGDCYVPYTDLYPSNIADPYVSWETKQEYFDVTIERVALGRAWVNAPDHQSALQMLEDQYGNWREPEEKS